MKKLIAAGALLTGLSVSSAAFAADCSTDVKKDDLSDEQVQSLYDCIKTELREGYASKGGELTAEYSSWKAASTLPAAPGVHSKRFLFTFVNDIGFDEYVKYSDERGPMPVGSIIAKESFNVSKKGKVKKGPLFFMTKAAAGGEADKYGNWVYAAFSTKGKVMKIKQSFCHDCHKAFEDQDALGYPVEDYRVSGN
ncbi:MAG: recombinase [Rhizobiaceae bacterium]|nr:recombinase [Rhizobiaceae bacterium]